MGDGEGRLREKLDGRDLALGLGNLGADDLIGDGGDFARKRVKKRRERGKLELVCKLTSVGKSQLFSEISAEIGACD